MRRTGSGGSHSDIPASNSRKSNSLEHDREADNAYPKTGHEESNEVCRTCFLSIILAVRIIVVQWWWWRLLIDTLDMATTGCWVPDEIIWTIFDKPLSKVAVPTTSTSSDRTFPVRAHHDYEFSHRLSAAPEVRPWERNSECHRETTQSLVGVLGLLSALSEHQVTAEESARPRSCLSSAPHLPGSLLPAKGRRLDWQEGNRLRDTAIAHSSGRADLNAGRRGELVRLG